jgi:hypothetical protein
MGTSDIHTTGMFGSTARPSPYTNFPVPSPMFNYGRPNLPMNKSSDHGILHDPNKATMSTAHVKKSHDNQHSLRTPSPSNECKEHRKGNTKRKAVSASPDVSSPVQRRPRRMATRSVRYAADVEDLESDESALTPHIPERLLRDNPAADPESFGSGPSPRRQTRPSDPNGRSSSVEFMKVKSRRQTKTSPDVTDEHNSPKKPPKQQQVSEDVGRVPRPRATSKKSASGSGSGAKAGLSNGTTTPVSCVKLGFRNKAFRRNAGWSTYFVLRQTRGILKPWKWDGDIRAANPEIYGRKGDVISDACFFYQIDPKKVVNDDMISFGANANSSRMMKWVGAS